MLQHNSVSTAAALDDDALTRKVVSLARNEREALVDFLHHLGEFDARRLYLGQGYPSLFEYCSGFLRLSNGTAHRRYTTARLMRRFPFIADFLRSGRLNTKRVALLRDVITEENHAELLELATQGTEKDVERLVATLNPKPNVTDGIRKLPSRAAVPAKDAEPLGSSTTAEAPPPLPREVESAALALPFASPGTAAVTSDSASSSVPPGSSVPVVPPPLTVPTGADTQTMTFASLTAAACARPHRMDVEPTSGTTFAVRMSVGPEFVAEFEEVKAALSHKFPNGNFEAVMRECFRITLEVVKRRRAGATRKRSANGTSAMTSASATSAPVRAVAQNASAGSASAATVTKASAGPASSSVTPPTANSSSDQSHSATAKPSRYVAAPVRQAVWERDGGRCAFVSKDGRRCGSKYQLELHHIDPYALGGAATVENLSLRCRQHNRHEAELAFGADFMQSLPFWTREDSAVANPQVDGPPELQADRGQPHGAPATAAGMPGPGGLH